MAAGKWNMRKASGGVASITVADGVGATNIVLPESGIVATTSNIVGFKNYIINGNFDIWQRGYNQTTSGYGSVDRWIIGGISNTTISRVAGIGGYSSYAMSVTASNASNTATISQVLESYICNVLKGKTVTLSFYCSSSINQPTNSLSYSITKNATGDTSTLGSFSHITGLLSSTTATTTATKHSVSVAIPNDGTANGIAINFTTSNITNGSSVYIYNVQLEEGSVATPFEQRPYGLELSLCQMYCRPISCAVQNQVTTTTGQNTTQNLYFPTMRVVPTVTNLSAVYTGSINNSSVTIFNNRIQYEFYYGALNTLGSGVRYDLLTAEL